MDENNFRGDLPVKLADYQNRNNLLEYPLHSSDHNQFVNHRDEISAEDGLNEDDNINNKNTGLKNAGKIKGNPSKCLMSICFNYSVEEVDNLNEETRAQTNLFFNSLGILTIRNPLEHKY